jgi:hypothetical protein
VLLLIVTPNTARLDMYLLRPGFLLRVFQEQYRFASRSQIVNSVIILQRENGHPVGGIRSGTPVPDRHSAPAPDGIRKHAKALIRPNTASTADLRRCSLTGHQVPSVPFLHPSRVAKAPRRQGW